LTAYQEQQQIHHLAARIVTVYLVWQPRSLSPVSNEVMEDHDELAFSWFGGDITDD